MTEVHQTDEFSNWLRRLKDDNVVARIVARIRRIKEIQAASKVSARA